MDILAMRSTYKGIGNDIRNEKSITYGVEKVKRLQGEKYFKRKKCDNIFQ